MFAQQVTGIKSSRRITRHALEQWLARTAESEGGDFQATNPVADSPWISIHAKSQEARLRFRERQIVTLTIAVANRICALPVLTIVGLLDLVLGRIVLWVPVNDESAVLP